MPGRRPTSFARRLCFSACHILAGKRQVQLRKKARKKRANRDSRNGMAISEALDSAA